MLQCGDSAILIAEERKHSRIEEREDLRCDLKEQPRNHRVGDGNLVNIAPLQLGEEIVIAHYVAGNRPDYLAFLIFTMLPFACWSVGSFTTVT